MIEELQRMVDRLQKEKQDILILNKTMRETALFTDE